MALRVRLLLTRQLYQRSGSAGQTKDVLEQEAREAEV
jgi:hypothetical protein